MALAANKLESTMEYAAVPDTELKISPVGPEFAAPPARS